VTSKAVAEDIRRLFDLPEETVVQQMVAPGAERILSRLARGLLSNKGYHGAVLSIERLPLEAEGGTTYLGHFDTVEEAEAYLADVDGKIIWCEIITGADNE